MASLPAYAEPGRYSVPQWMGTAMRGSSMASDVAAERGLMCLPSGGRTPHVSMGSRATSMRSWIWSISSNRAVSPAK